MSLGKNLAGTYSNVTKQLGTCPDKFYWQTLSNLFKQHKMFTVSKKELIKFLKEKVNELEQ